MYVHISIFMTSKKSGLIRSNIFNKFKVSKVENILKCSLDSIPSPSPSVKIQIMVGKVCLRCKRQNIVGPFQQTFENKKFVDITQQCFSLLPQVNFPANNLNFW